MKNLLILTAAVLSFGVFAQASEAGRDCKKVYRQATRVYNETVALADSQVREEYADALDRVNGRMEVAKNDNVACTAAASERYAADLKAGGGNKAVNEAIERREASNAICAADFSVAIEAAQLGYKNSVAASQVLFDTAVADARAEYDRTVQSCQ